jgi:hypothetical protein
MPRAGDMPQLFAVPVDERCLNDVERTILESIDARGPISANEAGRIVFQLRGYRHLRSIPRAWITSAGANTLRRLTEKGLVRRTRGSRWTRSKWPGSDLIGLYVVEASISTLKTPKALKASLRRSCTSSTAHTHDTPANRRFSGVPEPVTSGDSRSAAARSAERYEARRTEPLAPAALIRRGQLVRAVW